jgi:hypothetical protein
VLVRCALRQTQSARPDMPLTTTPRPTLGGRFDGPRGKGCACGPFGGCALGAGYTYDERAVHEFRLAQLAEAGRRSPVIATTRSGRPRAAPPPPGAKVASVSAPMTAASPAPRELLFPPPTPRGGRGRSKGSAAKDTVLPVASAPCDVPVAVAPRTGPPAPAVPILCQAADTNPPPSSLPLLFADENELVIEEGTAEDTDMALLTPPMAPTAVAVSPLARLVSDSLVVQSPPMPELPAPAGSQSMPLRSLSLVDYSPSPEPEPQ